MHTIIRKPGEGAGVPDILAAEPLYSPATLPWTFKEDGDANHYAIMDADGDWLLSLLHDGRYLNHRQIDNFKFIMRAANAHTALVEALTALRKNQRLVMMTRCGLSAEEADAMGVAVDADAALMLARGA